MAHCQFSTDLVPDKAVFYSFLQIPDVFVLISILQ